MPLPTHLDPEIYDSIATDTTLAHTERQLFVKWYSLTEPEDPGTQPTTPASVVAGADGSNGATDSSNGNAAIKRIQYQLKQDYR